MSCENKNNQEKKMKARPLKSMNWNLKINRNK